MSTPAESYTTTGAACPTVTRPSKILRQVGLTLNGVVHVDAVLALCGFIFRQFLSIFFINYYSCLRHPYINEREEERQQQFLQVGKEATSLENRCRP